MTSSLYTPCTHTLEVCHSPQEFVDSFFVCPQSKMAKVPMRTMLKCFYGYQTGT